MVSTFKNYLWKMPNHWFELSHKGIGVMPPISQGLAQSFAHHHPGIEPDLNVFLAEQKIYFRMKELLKHVEHEVQWLRYYGHRPSRIADNYDDAKFYDRVESIGYTKVVTPLPLRCVSSFVTADVPVLEAKPDELRFISGPRDHGKNVYTALEYFFGSNVHGIDQTKYRNILKEIKEEKK